MKQKNWTKREALIAAFVASICTTIFLVVIVTSLVVFVHQIVLGADGQEDPGRVFLGALVSGAVFVFCLSFVYLTSSIIDNTFDSIKEFFEVLAGDIDP